MMRQLTHTITLCALMLVIFCTSKAQVHISGSLEGVLGDTTYIVDGNIYVQEGDSLLIAPGAEFYFSGNYEFNIDGYLYCVGTEEDSVIFASAEGVPYWAGICFDQSAANSCCLGYAWITGGHAAGSLPYNCGGGILCYGCSPTIFNCKISGNSSSYCGGGIALRENYSGGLVIRDCQIWENTAEIDGGGIDVNMSSSPLLENLDIRGNIAATNYGGGICDAESSPLIVNCTISLNQSNLGGGGYYCYATWGATLQDCRFEENATGGLGGGIYFDFKVYNLLIEGCTISGNAAEKGGGVAFGCDGYGSIVDHCVIEDNYAELHGGGMICEGASGTASNCTFYGNEAGITGGAFYSCYELHDLSFVNNIVDGNSDGIYFERYGQDAITYCDFHDNPGGNFLGNAPANIGILSTTNSNGDSCDVYFNIFLDPAFVYPEQSDYRLQWGSPCIDAGDPDPVYNDPDGTVADMGAFYYDQSIPVRVLLTPHNMPIEIPPEGGSFDYTIWLTSIAPSQLVTVWCDVTLPDGSVSRPVLGPVEATLDSGQTLSRERTQVVPVGAPAGSYSYNACAVAGSDTSMDSFGFVKLGSGGMDELSGWLNIGEPFGVEGDSRIASGGMPEMYSLVQNYPNPFNPKTTISYKLSAVSHVNLAVYDSSGRKVAELVNGWRSAGTHEVTFDGSGLASGIYVYRMKAGGISSGKMVLLK